MGLVHRHRRKRLIQARSRILEARSQKPEARKNHRLFWLLASGFCFLSHCTVEQAASSHPPIILISVDTLRSDRLPIYGYGGVQTPNIDSLRRDSVLYERAYSPCPMTLPSHASIFTGLPPTEHEVRNNIGYRLDGAKITTLAEKLRQNGYATGGAVSSYVLRSDTGIADGFDVYEDSIPIATAGASSEHQRSGSITLEHANRFIEANRDGRFFLFFHIYEPHAPYLPPEPFKSRYRDPYDGEIAASDQIVGQLLDKLRNTGWYDQSLIVFLSDHGEGLWDHGEDQHGILLYRESLQVPLLVKLPKAARGGGRISKPFALSAVYHEILDAAGIEKSRPTDAPIYSETLYPRIHLGWSELRSLVDGRYHYIDAPAPELYDLVSDPGERKNIITTERRVAAALRRTMESLPSAITPIRKVDPEEAAKLAALGYVGTPKDRSGPLPNPRDEIGQLEEIKAAFRLADERRQDEAIAALQRLLGRNPGLTDVRAKLAELLINSGRSDEAVEVYKVAIARSERFSPDLALSLGFALLKADRREEAVQHAELALTLAPREAHELLARATGQMQHVEAALAAGDRQPATILLAGEIHRNAGRLTEALESVDQAEARARELGVDHLYGLDYLRADVLARLDRPSEAVDAYRREIAHSPQHLQSYANLALIHFIQGEREPGNQVLGEMVSKNPHSAAYLLAAKTLEVVGDQKGAARWRTRAAP